MWGAELYLKHLVGRFAVTYIVLQFPSIQREHSNVSFPWGIHRYVGYTGSIRHPSLFHTEPKRVACRWFVALSNVGRARSKAHSRLNNLIRNELRGFYRALEVS